MAVEKTRMRAAMRGTLVMIVCVGGGLALAVGSIVAAALMDNRPADSYDAGNRFAFFGFLVMLAVICPLVALGGYAFARGSDRSTGSSLTIGLCVAAVPAALVLALLLS